MDIFIPIVICIVILMLCSLCGYCCKRKRQGFVYGSSGTQVTITTHPQPVSASPVVVPPYPVDPRHPTPATVAAPAPGFATHNPPYPVHPQHPLPAAPYFYPPQWAGTSGVYPPATAAPYPYPPSVGGYPDYSSQPPPYHEAVSQPSVPNPPTNEGYAKQAPYNPNY